MVGPPFCDRALAFAENGTMENKTTDGSSAPAPAGCLLRMFWMLAGNGALFLSIILIAFKHAPLPSYLDAIVATTVILMSAARRLDIARFAGQTIDGEPATMAHWRTYTMILFGTTVLAWTLAHFISGNLSP